MHSVCGRLALVEAVVSSETAATLTVVVAIHHHLHSGERGKRRTVLSWYVCEV